MSPSLFDSEQLIPIHPRFPGKREISNTRPLPSTQSTWTLMDPHPEKQIEPRTDPLRQETLDELGPDDPSAPSPRLPDPGPQTSAEEDKVMTPGEPEPSKAVDTPGSPKLNSRPPAQNDSPPPGKPIGWFRKFMKSMSLPSCLNLCKRKEMAHIPLEELTCS